MDFDDLFHNSETTDIFASTETDQIFDDFLKDLETNSSPSSSSGVDTIDYPNTNSLDCIYDDISSKSSPSSETTSPSFSPETNFQCVTTQTQNLPGYVAQVPTKRIKLSTGKPQIEASLRSSSYEVPPRKPVADHNLDINSIDPSKPLHISSKSELNRLIHLGVVKVQAVNGQKTHVLDENELKKQQRKQKNRLSASESRRRQREYVILLEDKVKRLECTIEVLEKENAEMKEKLGLRSGQSKKMIQLPYRMVKEKSNVALFLTCIACCLCILSPDAEVSKHRNLSHGLKKRDLNNFDSRATFSDQRFSPDLQKLLSSPLVQAELDDKINNGQLCAMSLKLDYSCTIFTI